MRYVVVDTCEPHGKETDAWGVHTDMTQQQLIWLAQEALHLPDDGWSVVVMGHVPCIDSLSGSAPKLVALREILGAFRNRRCCGFTDFTNACGKLVAYLCGHNHMDRMHEDDCVIHISTGCDAYCKDDNLPREVGRLENTLFDLFLVDTDNCVVNVFRIGAGVDRTFTY